MCPLYAGKEFDEIDEGAIDFLFGDPDFECNNCADDVSDHGTFTHEDFVDGSITNTFDDADDDDDDDSDDDDTDAPFDVYFVTS